MTTSYEILEALSWRYATKKFDPTKTLSQDDVAFLLETMRMAPTSYGLQPWKAFVVTNPELRQKLLPVSYNQPKVVDASHFVVIAVPTTIDSSYIDRYLEFTAKTREVKVSELTEFGSMMKGFIKGKTSEELRQWAARQAYIALGFLLESTALCRIDACPMEGFIPQRVDEILNLSSKGYASVVACALGTRAADDAFMKLKKVRYPTDVMFELME
ncbi:MAG: NAD(P)H-dependent oxidoreductase [Deltaproteobacteria bacterium]|nr:NAD(P)H-dependent oxidoreductase [Deltaproteobacteria bacterium]